MVVTVVVLVLVRSGNGVGVGIRICGIGAGVYVAVIVGGGHPFFGCCCCSSWCSDVAADAVVIGVGFRCGWCFSVDVAISLVSFLHDDRASFRFILSHTRYARALCHQIPSFFTC